MVFKNKLFFSSSKKSETSSPDGSNNSPRSIGSNSPIRSDKKKGSKSKNSTPTTPTSTGSSSNFTCKQTQVKDGVKKKDSFFKGKETVNQPQTPTKPGTSNSGTGLKSKKGGVLVENKEKEAEKSSVSPILASSLGLNRIKTRSGPLPQESFFGFRGDKGSGVLGSSNLSRRGGDGGSGSNSSSLGSGKKKEGIEGQSKLTGFQESGNGGDNWDSMSTGSGGGQSREVSPNLQARTRLQNGESSSEAGMMFSFSFSVMLLAYFLIGIALNVVNCLLVLVDYIWSHIWSSVFD
jgi:thiol:disulfide interchange protein